MEGEGALRAPRRINLEAIAHKNAEAAQALVPPPLSAAGEALLRIYGELARTRAFSESGIAPITYAEINAWEHRRRVRISLWQEETILAIDAVVRSAHADELNDDGADGAGESERLPESQA